MKNGKELLLVLSVLGFLGTTGYFAWDGCAGGVGGTNVTFQDAAEQVYARCDGGRIRVLTSEKALQLVFEPCGSNNFINFRWSPDGLNLYYRSNAGPWVFRDTHENLPLRMGMPSAEVAWFNNAMIAFPDSTGRKIGVYNSVSHILNYAEIDQIGPEQLVKGAEIDEILYLASETPGGLKSIYRLRANTVETERAFPWMPEGVATFSYHVPSDTVCSRDEGSTEVICAAGEDGAPRWSLKGRDRAVLSADGRYLLSEGEGEEVTIKLSGAAANYDADGVAPSGSEALPDYMPRTVKPPSFWIRDTETGEELLWEGVHGTHFQWYDAVPYNASFVLWGINGEQLNANITLVDLRHFLKSKGWEPPLAVDGKPVQALGELGE